VIDIKKFSFHLLVFTSGGMTPARGKCEQKTG